MKKGALEDKFLKEELSKLVSDFKIDTIVETGTYMGWSTGILAQVCQNVISIEINEEWHRKAKELNKQHNNIRFHLGSSQAVLQEVISSNASNFLFFLDAHWGEYWPLLDELTVISRKKIKPVIIIHDFFVPRTDDTSKSKFGYDKYDDRVLDYDYVRQHMDKIYGDAAYTHYCLQDSEIDAGVGIFLPKR